MRLCENGRFFSENGKFYICTMNNMRILSEYKTLYSSDKFHFISEKFFSGADLKVTFNNSEIHIGKYAFTGFCEHLIAVKHKSEVLLIHSGWRKQCGIYAVYKPLWRFILYYRNFLGRFAFMWCSVRLSVAERDNTAQLLPFCNRISVFTLAYDIATQQLSSPSCAARSTSCSP